MQVYGFLYNLSMILYRGTNKIIRQPKINPQSRFLCFGQGIYLTANKKRAERDALEFTYRMQCGSPVVNVYEIDKKALKGLKVLKVARPNMDWLKLVMSCHSGKYPETEYDVIIAPFPYSHLAHRIASLEDSPELTPKLYEPCNRFFFLKTVLKTDRGLSLLKYKTSLEVRSKSYREDFVDGFSRYNLTSNIIDCFVARTGMNEREALRKLYASKLYEKMSDPLLKTICFSSSALAEMLVSELETGKFSYPDEDL